MLELHDAPNFNPRCAIYSAPHSGGSRGGGPGGPDPPPPFGPRCRLFNIGPKVGPPPPFVNVQEWGCFSIFLRANDVTRTMSKGGVRL